MDSTTYWFNAVKLSASNLGNCKRMRPKSEYLPSARDFLFESECGIRGRERFDAR